MVESISRYEAIYLCSDNAQTLQDALDKYTAGDVRDSWFLIKFYRQRHFHFFPAHADRSFGISRNVDTIF
jgi:hypothetical protein